MAPKQNKPEKPTAPVENYAVTLSGWHLLHRIKDREPSRRVTAKGDSVVNTAYFDEIDRNKDEIIRPAPFDATEEELQEPKLGFSKYLVVGLALPPSYIKKHAKVAESFYKSPEGKGVTIGCEKPDVTRVIDVLDKEGVPKSKGGCTPMLVVAPTKGSKKNMNSLGCLLHQTDGICTPYSIEKRDVFFFPEFRSTDTNKGERSKVWMAKVMNVIDSSNESCMLNPTAHPKIILEPKESFRNHTKMALSLYRQNSNDLSPLKQLGDHLKSIEDREKQVVAGGGIIDFFDPEAEDNLDASEAEIRAAWPGLKFKTTALKTLRRGIRLAGFGVDHQDLRQFLGGALYDIEHGREGLDEDNPISDEEAKRIALFCWRRAKQAEHVPAKEPDFSENEAAKMLHGIYERLRESKIAIEDARRELSEPFGDPGTLPDVKNPDFKDIDNPAVILEHLAASCDRDTHIYWLGQHARCVARHYNLIELQATEEINKVVDVMRRFLESEK